MRPVPPEHRGCGDQAPSSASGRYNCLAVTSDIPATAGNRAGVVGHPYRAKIDFLTGRYAFCKIRGRPGELRGARRLARGGAEGLRRLGPQAALVYPTCDRTAAVVVAAGVDVAEAADAPGARDAVGQVGEQLLVQAGELALLGRGQEAEHARELALAPRQDRLRAPMRPSP